MERKALGTHGPEVGAIGLGTMGLGGRYERDETGDPAAVALIRKAFELGVTLYDTAEVYGAGHGEEILGRAVAPFRDEVVISTKFSSANSTRDAVIAAAEASLKRLATDRIDLYQPHWPNPSVPLEETVDALEFLWRAGKIRFVGLSNTTVAEAAGFASLLPSGLNALSVQQDFSLAERFVEHRLLPFCRTAGMALIAYSPVAQGRLAHEGNDSRTKLLGTLARRNGLTPAQLALAWVASRENVVPLPMTSRLEHLEANVAALEARVPREDLDRLAEAFAYPIEEIATDRIDVVASHTGKAYTNVAEARANTLDLSPSPAALAEELRGGELLKPVKVRRAADGRYELFEGQLRYWAWVIAHDGQAPIPASIHEGSSH